MNILWLTNIPLPEASELLNERSIPFGGWMVNTSMALSEQDNVNLSISFPEKEISKIKILKGKRIKYYAFSTVSNKIVASNCCNVQFEQILGRVKPDIVHIFGTEYLNTLLMVNTCNKMNIKVVISIQGLVSVYYHHYMAYLSDKVMRRFTFRDLIKQDNLKQQQKKFVNRGKFEIEAIQKVHHVIGRTTWDKACTTQINPNVKYHFCNETLREEFYKHQWSLEKCERNSIFVSQSSYPIKGIHLMLEAMPLILKTFPNTKLYISGYDITKSDTLKEKLKKTSYAKYIIEIIQKYNLKNNVIFTDLLDEKQMCERYLESNVFVCPSSIENSPNSLGEAMILGVPCVASDVGGVSDMLKHKEEGFLYQADAPYMLAYYVCEIFGNEEIALKFSRNSRKHALKTHDREVNLNRLLNIYKELTNEQ
jgi:glycosyltransferase involved in cell wall biosynthesis